VPQFELVLRVEPVLKGRGFSRAVNAAKSIAALAAGGRVFQTEPLLTGVPPWRNSPESCKIKFSVTALEGFQSYGTSL
jgi:hypothetical protein